MVKGLFLKLRQAIEAHNRTDNHVTDFKLLADPSGCPSRKNELGLHFGDNLPPHVFIRKLRAVLRHMGIGLEHDHRRPAILVVQ